MHIRSRLCRQMLPHSEESSTLLKKMSAHFGVTSFISWTSSRSSLTTFINICTLLHHLPEALMLDSFSVPPQWGHCLFLVWGVFIVFNYYYSQTHYGFNYFRIIYYFSVLKFYSYPFYLFLFTKYAFIFCNFGYYFHLFLISIIIIMFSFIFVTIFICFLFTISFFQLYNMLLIPCNTLLKIEIN